MGGVDLEKREGCKETERGEMIGFKDAKMPHPSLVPFSKFASIINGVKDDELISDIEFRENSF